MESSSTLGQLVPLGTQWPTLDPFLFCAHHLDAYPVGDGKLGPSASLDGRSIGQDFAGIDGWNMYHGSSVPGFPQHPHRGFETVTYVRSGWCDHSDSLGARARFGQGDTQWLTAGRGIVHSEMFPLLRTDVDNPLQLFQIWLNLPSTNKMVEPYFSMRWADQQPTVDIATGVRVTLIAGDFGDHRAQDPPPDSWAVGGGVEIWHLQLDAGSACELPAAAPGASRMLYCFAGTEVDPTTAGGVLVDSSPLGIDQGAEVDASRRVTLTAPGTAAELLVLSGLPIGEPVAQYGPFVMNDHAGLERAIRDYRSTAFGGWPWPSDDPVHGTDATRFASYPDGRTEHP